jgi:uncharacterized protein involved in exopolysaccharide biosynthesis
MNSTTEPARNGTPPEVERAWAPERASIERDSEVDVLQVYARVLRRWPKTIAISVLLAAGITGVISKFFLTKWYEATAVIRPVSQAAIHEQLLGSMSAFGTGGGTGVSGLLGNLTGGSDADEYVSILNSFTFELALIKRHHLVKVLLPSGDFSPAALDSSRHLQWLAYRSMQGRLRVENSAKTGNINIQFQATDPAQAEAVMKYMIDDFRELLRQKQVNDVKAAVRSLEEQARRTPDIILQSALYELVADQIQREKLAEVESDFAFTVIDGPSASDIKVWPPTRLLCLLAALAAFVIVAVYILFFHSEPLSTAAHLVLRDELGKRHEAHVLTDATRHRAS